MDFDKFAVVEGNFLSGRHGTVKALISQANTKIEQSSPKIEEVMLNIE